MSANLRVACSRCALSLLIMVFLSIPVGCQGDRRAPLSDQSPSRPIIQTLVVVGFHAAMTDGKEPEMVRNPITGTSFMSWPVRDDVVDWLNNQLFEMVAQDKERNLIPPGQAQGVIESIMTSDAQLGIHPLEMIKKIGKTFGADAVLIGQVYRWQERLGADYGVETPASVAFDLSLLRPSDGAILWRGNYDKTQKSLFENLFDLSTYVKSGGRWLTAKELARFGLEHLLSEIPIATGQKEGKE